MLLRKLKTLSSLFRNLALLPEIERKISTLDGQRSQCVEIDRKLSALIEGQRQVATSMRAIDIRQSIPSEPFQSVLSFSPREMASRGIDHDGLTYRPHHELITLAQLSDTIHASDTYTNGSVGRQEYIDSQLPRLSRVFDNLHSFRTIFQGPTLDVASGWGILYPAFRKFLAATLPYSVAEMGDFGGLTIDGDILDGCAFQCEKDTLCYGDESFGLVCFFDCIEHLIVDPLWPLLEFNRVLRVGGHIAISTPNAVNVQKIVQIARGDNPATDSHIKPASIYQRHNREYTAVELSQALECCGFGNVHYSTNPQSLSQTELDILADLHVKGLVGKPYQYFGPELFLLAEKVQDVNLGTQLSQEQRWPAWLYTGFDAYRKRPKVFPIIVSDDYS